MRSSRIRLFPLILFALMGFTVLSAFLVSSHLGRRDTYNTLDEPRLGASPDVFGLRDTYDEKAQFFSNHGVLVSWDTQGETEYVEAIAEFWDRERQLTFVHSRQELVDAVTNYVEKWGPRDARSINSNRYGGAQFSYYESRLLSDIFRSLEVPNEDARAGMFTVVTILDTSMHESDIPLSTSHGFDMRHVSESLFTQALVLGRPWGES